MSLVSLTSTQTNVQLSTSINHITKTVNRLSFEFNKIKISEDQIVSVNHDTLKHRIEELELLRTQIMDIQSLVFVHQKQFCILNHTPSRCAPSTDPDQSDLILVSNPIYEGQNSCRLSQKNHSQVNTKLDFLASSIEVELALYRQFLNSDITTMLNTAINDSDHDYDCIDFASNVESVTSSPLHRSNRTQPDDLHSMPMSWLPIPSIPEVLNQLNLGSPQCIHSFLGKLVIGTSRGAIAVFILPSMQIEHILLTSAKDGSLLSPTTTVIFSSSAQFLVSGHSSGTLILWNVVKGSAIKIIEPISNFNSFEKSKIGHVKGSRISHICFVGQSDRRFVSVDELGVAFLHTVSLKLFEISSICRLFGSYTNRLNRTKLTTVFSVVSFRRYVAILTPFKLVILDTRPVRTVVRLLRMSTPAPNIGPMSTSGSLIIVGNTLFVTWSNWMRLVSLDINPDNTLLANMVIDLELPNSITVMRQVDERYLALFTTDKKIDFFSLLFKSIIESMTVPYLVGTDDRLAVTRNLGHCAEVNYSPCISTGLNNTILIIGEDDKLYIGAFVSAPERLMAMGLAAQTPKLVHFALDLAFSQCASYVVALPLPVESNGSRSSAFEATLSDMVCGAALQALRTTLNPSVDIPQLMGLLSTIPDAEPFIYDHFYDVSICESSNEHRSAYFRGLLKLVLDNEVHCVPPGILSELFEELVMTSCTDEYTKLLCTIDPTSLDLDAAVRICQQFGDPQGLIHLYVIMGQASAGFDAVDLSLSIEFIINALTKAKYSSKDQDYIVLWIDDHLQMLLRGDYVDENNDKHFLKASQVTQAVQLSLLHSPNHRARLFEHLKTVRSRSITNSENETQCAMAAFASALVILAAKAHPQHVSIESGECFVYLNELIAIYTPGCSTLPTSPASICGDAFFNCICWPPQDIVEEAVIHLITVLTLSDSQIGELTVQFENCKWWSVCEHLANKTNDFPRVIKYLVADHNQSQRIFFQLADLIAPLSESEEVTLFQTTSQKWDAHMCAQVSQSLLSVLVQLCDIDTELTAWLIATHARSLLHAAHAILEGTSHQVKFRTALSGMDPSPISGPLLRLCFADQSHLGPLDGDLAASRFVRRHLSIASSSDVYDWVETCRKHDFSCTESILWESLGQFDEALDALLKPFANLHIANYFLQAVNLCHRTCHEAHWVKLIRALLTHFAKMLNFDAHEQMIRKVFLEMHAIPSVLLHLVQSLTNGNSMSKVLIFILQIALTTHRMHLELNRTINDIVHQDLVEQANHIISSHLTGFELPARNFLDPCVVCGVSVYCNEGDMLFHRNNEWAWPCGHIAHLKCVQSGHPLSQQCVICDPTRHKHYYLKEVMGKASMMDSAGAAGLVIKKSPTKVAQVTNYLPGYIGVPLNDSNIDAYQPEFYRPQRPEWHDMLSGMLHQLNAEG